MVRDVVAAELDRVHEGIAGRFGRAEPRARVREYVSGLVAGLERRNGWTLAERAGEVSPDGMQRLLRRADWDADAVRDDIRGLLGGSRARMSLTSADVPYMSTDLPRDLDSSDRSGQISR
jgi:hypothetical protein